MGRHLSSEQLRLRSRERMVNAGMIDLCKTPECYTGTDTQPLSSDGYCLSCVKERKADERRQIERLIAEEQGEVGTW